MAVSAADDEDIYNLEMWVCKYCYKGSIYARKGFIIVTGEKETAGMLPAPKTRRYCGRQKKWLFGGKGMDVLLFVWLVWSIEVLEVKFVLLFGVWLLRTPKKCAAREKKRYVE